MSSFLFLHFCDDALRLLGLYFSAFHPFKTFLRWFLPPPSKPPRGPHTASTGRVRSFPGVVPLPGPQNRTQGCTGPSFGFLSRTSLPLPLKGEGLVFVQFWVVLVCWTRPQRPHTAPTARVWGLASVPHLYPVPKSAHRAAQEDFPLFRQSRIRTQADQAEEKIPLPHFSEMEPVKSVIPCKRFFKPSGVKSFSLFMRRKFCGGIPVRKELSWLTFSPYKAANPACPGPGSYHLNLWWERLTPPCLAPICTPRPLGWAGSCTGAHRFVLCRLSLGRWFSPCR